MALDKPKSENLGENKWQQKKIYNIIYNQREKIANLRIYQCWILHDTVWFKPVLRCENPQYTRNYDAIQIMDFPIWKIVLKLDQLITQFNFNIKY